MFGLLFTMQNNSSFDIGITSTTVFELLSLAMHLVVFMILPGENLEHSAREMLKILIEIDESTRNSNNIRAVSIGPDFDASWKDNLSFQKNLLLVQLQHQSMNVSIFKVIVLDKASMTFLFVEISSWFFTLNQFELNSINEVKQQQS